MTNKIIKEKGIRYVHIDANGDELSKDKTKENGDNKCIGTSSSKFDPKVFNWTGVLTKLLGKFN